MNPLSRSSTATRSGAAGIDGEAELRGTLVSSPPEMAFIISPRSVGEPAAARGAVIGVSQDVHSEYSLFARGSRSSGADDRRTHRHDGAIGELREQSGDHERDLLADV